jgi:hypothetical protein
VEGFTDPGLQMSRQPRITRHVENLQYEEKKPKQASRKESVGENRDHARRKTLF